LIINFLRKKYFSKFCKKKSRTLQKEALEVLLPLKSLASEGLGLARLKGIARAVSQNQQLSFALAWLIVNPFLLLPPDLKTSGGYESIWRIFHPDSGAESRVVSISIRH
jgi:hypothetical protein